MTNISFVNDVCTLEQAKKFKKLGIKQEAFMMFNTHYKEVYTYNEYVEIMKEKLNLSEYFVARYNTGELIAMVQPIHIWSAQSFAYLLLNCLRTKTLTVAEVNRRLDEFHGVKKE